LERAPIMINNFVNEKNRKYSQSKCCDIMAKFKAPKGIRDGEKLAFDIEARYIVEAVMRV